MTLAEAQAYLVAAEKAYHSLVVGTSVRVAVDQNNERVEYTAANRADLRAYIERLKLFIANGGQESSGGRGPMGVFF